MTFEKVGNHFVSSGVRLYCFMWQTKVFTYLICSLLVVFFLNIEIRKIYRSQLQYKIT